MKTFKDLVFKAHPIKATEGIQAEVKFNNGCDISVIQGKHFYSGKDTYEVMVTYADGESDIIGYKNENQITNIMIDTQNIF